MVDIFKKQICNYCKNTQCKENDYCKYKLIKINKDELKVFKCLDYKKKNIEK